MSLFGKGRARMEVIAAEFLPYGKHLFILVADTESNLHVLQYDPERKQPAFLLSLKLQMLITKRIPQIQNPYKANVCYTKALSIQATSHGL
jgi:hypothetical protein